MEHTTPKPRRRRNHHRRRWNPYFFVTLGIGALVLILMISLIAGIMSPPSGQPDESTGNTTDTPESTAETTPSTTLPEETTVPETTTEATVPEGVLYEEMYWYALDNGFSYWDYPEKILELYGRNPDARQFCLDYPLLKDKESTADMSAYENTEGVPLFVQWDAQWGYFDYGGELMGLSGCGPTSLAMVAYYFTGDPDMNPLNIAQFALDNGYRIKDHGTAWTLISEGSTKLGLEVRTLPLHEGTMIQALNNGEKIICNVGEGVFTTGIHYIVIVGYEDGLFYVNDSNSYERSARGWAYEEFYDQINNLWALRG